jgi:hypothetical protein
MQSFQTIPATPHDTGSIHTALSSLFDEFCGTLARLVAYLCTLALFFIFGVCLWNQLPQDAVGEPTSRSSWTVASRSNPAFSTSQIDLSYKTKTYQIFRHPEAGRRDLMRWESETGQAVAELEIHRPAGEFESTLLQAMAEAASRMSPSGLQALEAAGVVDSKFGAINLFGLTGADGRGCLGFVKPIDQPQLRISGFSCQGDAMPVRRAAIGCMLNRLTLLTAGNDARLAELFARAELKRHDCQAPSQPGLTADWITTAGNPSLRGPF